MYQNGVLTVTVGKAQSAQPRRIEIRAGDGQQQQGMGRSDRQGERRGDRQAT
jgi:hypothetical protein